MSKREPPPADPMESPDLEPGDWREYAIAFALLIPPFIFFLVLLYIASHP